ncbi:HD domain-containing protein [Geodermatophilus normandii]|nr:HD domain-containing protein [Geodermatophilus normandii]
MTGGQYRVRGQEQRGETTHVRLRWIDASGEGVGSDELLLAVLGAVPGVVGSSLTRSADTETLELRLGAEDSATVTRARDAGEVRVVRYWPLASGWGARGDDPDNQWGRRPGGLADDDGTGDGRGARRRHHERTGRMTTLEDRKTVGSGPLSTRYDDAFAYAAEHHRKQLRKGSQVPYLTHLMSVSALVLEHGGSEDQAIAGLLHDAVEDAPAGTGGEVLAEIRLRFGDDVADIVRACSDGLDADGNRSGTWRERKEAYVSGLGDKPLDALLVTAADKTHNGLCIAADVRRYGQAFWSTFNASREELLWYYTSVERAVVERLPDSSIAAALQRAVDDLRSAA